MLEKLLGSRRQWALEYSQTPSRGPQGVRREKLRLSPPLGSGIKVSKWTCGLNFCKIKACQNRVCVF